MSSQAGWYPDPGGQHGLYRYWDGNAWSAATTTNPQSGPPSQGIVQGASGQNQAGGQSDGQSSYGQSSYGQSYGQQGAGQQSGQGYGYDYGQQANPYSQTYSGGGAGPQRRRSTKAWWIAAAAVVLALVVVGVLGIRQLVRNVAGGGDPGGQPTTQLCPTSSLDPSPPAHANDGRVHGGALSFPQLPPPWNPPQPDDRVPFARDVMEQSVMVHANYQGQNSWVASVLVAELIAGDGFFTPQQGSEIVVKCVTGTFYGTGTQVARDDQVNKATKVDGKDAWLVESHLTFDIPNLPTKGELLIVLIVATGDATSSLFYASVPDDSPQYVQPARDAMANLKVGS